MIDINDKQYYMYFISSIYDLEYDKIRDFKINNDELEFNYGENKSYSVNKSFILDSINSINSVELKNKSANRIAYVIQADRFNYFLSTYYLEFILLKKFVLMFNNLGYGVDIVTDEDISRVLPDEIKGMDITINFSPINNKNADVESNLINSINHHSRNRMYPIVKFIACNDVSIKCLNEASIPIDKKMAFIHSQFITNYPNNTSLCENRVSTFKILDALNDVNFDICVTDEDVYSQISSIYKTKNIKLISEYGYSQADINPHAYMENVDSNKNKLLIKFSNYNDLDIAINVCKPLSYQMTVMISDDVNEYDIIDYMKTKDYDNFIVINEKYFNLLRDYNIMIDFNSYEECIENPNIITIYNKSDIINPIETQNIKCIDKANIVSIIKIILLSQTTMVKTLSQRSFTPTQSLTEEQKNEIKKIFR